MTQQITATHLPITTLYTVAHYVTETDWVYLLAHSGWWLCISWGLRRPLDGGYVRLEFEAASEWWLCTSWSLRRPLDGDYVHLEVQGGIWMMAMYILSFKAASGWWLWTSWGLKPLPTLRVRTHCFRSSICPTMPFCPLVCFMIGSTNVLSLNSTLFFPSIREKSISRAFKLSHNSSWTWCSASSLHQTQNTMPQCHYNVTYSTTAFVNMEVTQRVSGKYRFLVGGITNTKTRHQEL